MAIERYKLEFSTLDEAISKLKTFLKGKEGRYIGVLWLCPYSGGSFAEQVKSYIDTHFCELHSTKQLQDIFNKSRFTIIRHFKNAYGVTPGRYLRNLKMMYAIMLRKEGKLWKQVAQDIGYKSTRFRQFLYHFDTKC